MLYLHAMGADFNPKMPASAENIQSIGTFRYNSRIDPDTKAASGTDVM